jgi:hypothetical protein
MFHGGGGAGEELPCFVAAGIPGAFAVAAAFLIIVVFFGPGIGFYG